MSKALDFVWQEANRHPRRFLIADRVNQRAVARAMGVHPSTVTRLIKGETHDISPELLDALGRLAGITSRADVLDAIEHAPPRPRSAFLKN